MTVSRWCAAPEPEIWEEINEDGTTTPFPVDQHRRYLIERHPGHNEPSHRHCCWGPDETESRDCTCSCHDAIQEQQRHKARIATTTEEGVVVLADDELRRVTAQRDQLRADVQRLNETLANGFSAKLQAAIESGEPRACSQVHIRDLDTAGGDALRAEVRRLDLRLRWIHDHYDDEATTALMTTMKLAEQRDLAEGERYDLQRRLDAVRALHRRTQVAGNAICGHCDDLCHSASGLGCDAPYDAAWPCPTIRAIGEEPGDV